MYCLRIMGPAISDYKKRLILLSMILLSGGHCSTDVETHAFFYFKFLQVQELKSYRTSKDEGYLLPQNPLNEESDWFCGNCSRRKSWKEIRDLIDSIKTEIDECADNEDSLFACLSKARKLLHSNHQVSHFYAGCSKKLDHFMYLKIIFSDKWNGPAFRYGPIKMANLTTVVDGSSLEVDPHFLPRTKNKCTISSITFLGDGSKKLDHFIMHYWQNCLAFSPYKLMDEIEFRAGRFFWREVSAKIENVLRK